MFIVLEGIDGAGKTTQMAFLKEHLTQRRLQATVLHEPGGTALGEALRLLLKHGREVALGPETELLLFLASRAQLVQEAIRPALRAGHVVLCDRFSASTLAYQGYGRRLDMAGVRQICRFATDGLTPDLTVLLNVPVRVGLERKRKARDSGESSLQLTMFDRFEDEEMAFHDRVRQGYLRLAAEALESPEQGLWRVIDGTPAPEVVFQQVWAAVESGLAQPSPQRALTLSQEGEGTEPTAEGTE